MRRPTTTPGIANRRFSPRGEGGDTVKKIEFTRLRCEETPFTPFAMNRARGTDLSDAVQGACRACAALHVRRR